jgi:hypothetical protein
MHTILQKRIIFSKLEKKKENNDKCLCFKANRKYVAIISSILALTKLIKKKEKISSYIRKLKMDRVQSHI